jgi:hypothetical protein
MLKNPAVTWELHCYGKFDLTFLTNRGLSRRMTWNASGDEGGTKAGFNTISLERLQCAMRDSADPTERRRRKR